MPTAGTRTFDHAEIVTLGKSGLVAREIAEQLGCSKSLAGNVMKAARDAGEVIPRARRSARDPETPLIPRAEKPPVVVVVKEHRNRSIFEEDGLYTPPPKITADEAATVRADLQRRGLNELIAMLGISEVVAS
jgi:hypothetical protein